MSELLEKSDHSTLSALNRQEDKSFRQVHAVSKQIIRRSLGHERSELSRYVKLALKDQSPTEYPFLFRYAYATVETDCAKVQTLSAAVHLLQTSTFVIDDIFDRSRRRNHNETIFQRYGVDYAIIAGEILQSAALEAISSELVSDVFCNKSLVMKIFNRVVRDVYRGQFLDIYNSSNHRITVANYYRLICLTTGLFLANVAQCGALLADKPISEIKALRRFGYRYGMALQISDDIVDITDKTNLTGKSFANDLKCRRMRLPYILALEMASKKDRTTLRDFLRRDSYSKAEVADVAKLIRRSGALDACKDISGRYVRGSLKSIASLKNTLTKERLKWLSENLFRAQEL